MNTAPTNQETSTDKRRRVASIAILVAALGYFVDVYDLVLFSVVRVPSLQSLGLSGDELLKQGAFLLNMQQTGLLLGGIFWGILGDKRGRVSVLFGSITLYSIANIANGFVGSIEAYAFWRFLAGLGLAGELGAGITLVSEIMSKESRGYGTTLVATIGVAGAVVAGLVGGEFDWRVAFWTGGGLGLLLLILRILVHESGMFAALTEDTVNRGNFLSLFTSADRFRRFVCSVLCGLPIWFCVGVLLTFAPEFGAAFGMAVKPTAGQAILYGYTGFVLGDLVSGLLSQLFRSRKKILFLFILLSSAAITLFLTQTNATPASFYLLCAVVGFAGGYWAVFVSSAAEQFGTNLRATVTTTVPNFVRGSAVLLVSMFTALRPEHGILGSAAMTGGLTIVIALGATFMLKESFGKDLEFLEE